MLTDDTGNACLREAKTDRKEGEKKEGRRGEEVRRQLEQGSCSPQTTQSAGSDGITQDPPVAWSWAPPQLLLTLLTNAFLETHQGISQVVLIARPLSLIKLLTELQEKNFAVCNITAIRGI